MYYDGKKKPSSESLLAWNLLKDKPTGVKWYIVIAEK